MEEKATTKEVLKSASHFLVPHILEEMEKMIKAGHPEITVFEIINPLTQSFFTTDEAEILLEGELRRLKAEIPTEVDERTNLTELIPMFDGKKPGTQAQFQMAVKKYLRNAPAQQQLLLLNKIQKNTPFLIMDPRRRFTQGFTYGPADLLRFICEPVQSGEVYRFIKNSPDGSKNFENPFYNPIRYPLPDVMGNRILTNLMKGTREFYLRKLDDLRRLLHLIVHKKATKPQKMAGVSKAFKVLQEIYEKRNNPVYLSQFVKGQERPMFEYRKTHFIELLEQLSTAKRAHPATLGDAPPETTGVSIVGPELNISSKALHARGRRRSKSRRRSRR